MLNNIFHICVYMSVMIFQITSHIYIHVMSYLAKLCWRDKVTFIDAHYCIVVVIQKKKEEVMRFSYMC